MKSKSVFANVSVTEVGAELLPTFSPDDQSGRLLPFTLFFYFPSHSVFTFLPDHNAVHNNHNMTSSLNHAAAENDFPYF